MAGTEAALTSSAVVTFLLGPWRLRIYRVSQEKARAASAKSATEEAVGRVVTVVAECHFLRTELRPVVLGLPQTP